MKKGSKHSMETKQKMRLNHLGMTGKNHSKETKNRMSQAKKGRTFSEGHKRKISEGKKGNIPWNKGQQFSKEYKKKLSLAHKGQITWNKNKTGIYSLETLRKMSLSQIGHQTSTETKQKIRLTSIGRKHSEKAKQKISIALKGKRNGSWKGGISFGLYGVEFDNFLRHKIRKRDSFTCQECGISQKELNRKLAVHHIDYNKNNNTESNLITLCTTCNSKVNYSREDWEKYFKEKIKDIWEAEC